MTPKPRVHFPKDTVWISPGYQGSKNYDPTLNLTEELGKQKAESPDTHEIKPTSSASKIAMRENQKRKGR